MRVALHKVYEQSELPDFDLVHILRMLSMLDTSSVIGRSWIVTDDVIANIYANRPLSNGEAISYLFPELDLVEQRHNRWTDEIGEMVLVSGERLLERSALIHQLEAGLFLRIKDPEKPVSISLDRHRLRPKTFVATNVDLEIWNDDFGPFEVVTEDEELASFLQSQFQVTELSRF